MMASHLIYSANYGEIERDCDLVGEVLLGRGKWGVKGGKRTRGRTCWARIYIPVVD